MRDYAELVKSLRLCAKGHCESGCMCFRADLPFAGCTIDQDEDDLKLFAADAIEELLAESADLNGQVKRSQEEIRKLDKLLAAVPHWISVEERLPDVAEKVLTYNGDFVSENWLCTVASKVGRVNVWAYSEGFVTHWTPLPTPPKEETE